MTQVSKKLLLAVKHAKHTITIFNLIRRKADLNFVDESGKTALWYAVAHKNIQLIDLLIKFGANVNHRNNIGENLLCLIYDEISIITTPNTCNQIELNENYFTEQLNNSIALKLIDAGIDFLNMDNNNLSLIKYAILCNNTFLLIDLIKKKIISVMDLIKLGYKQSLLAYEQPWFPVIACLSDESYKDILKEFLACGFECVTGWDSSLFKYLQENYYNHVYCNITIVLKHMNYYLLDYSSLIKNFIKVKCATEKTTQLIIQWIEYNYISVKELVALGYKEKLEQEKKLYLPTIVCVKTMNLSLELQNICTRTLKELLNYGFTFHSPIEWSMEPYDSTSYEPTDRYSYYHKNPLFFTSKQKNLIAFKVILRHIQQTKDYEPTKPLIYHAIADGSIDIIRLLIKYNIINNITVKTTLDNQYNTLLHIAIKNHWMYHDNGSKLLRILLKFEFNFLAKNEHQETILDLANVSSLSNKIKKMLAKKTEEYTKSILISFFYKMSDSKNNYSSNSNSHSNDTSKNKEDSKQQTTTRPYKEQDEMNNTKSVLFNSSLLRLV